MFATMKPYAPPPPPGAQPPPLWGDEDARPRPCSATGSPSVDGATGSGDGRPVRHRPRRSATSSRRAYGPTIAVYRSIADDPARAAELSQALAAHGDAYLGSGPMQWESLLLVRGARVERAQRVATGTAGVQRHPALDR